MVYAAIKGLAENIGDPYTTFFSPEDAKKFSEDVNGEFGGIGAELENRDGQVVVVALGTDADLNIETEQAQAPVRNQHIGRLEVVVQHADAQLYRDRQLIDYASVVKPEGQKNLVTQLFDDPDDRRRHQPKHTSPERLT